MNAAPDLHCIDWLSIFSTRSRKRTVIDSGYTLKMYITRRLPLRTMKRIVLLRHFSDDN